LVLSPVPTQHPRSLARSRQGVPHFGRFHQIFDISQPLCPTIEIATSDWPNAPTFPAAKIIRGSITSNVEEVIELETTAIRTAASATVIPPSLIPRITSISESAAVARTRLLVPLTLALLSAWLILSLSWLLALATLLTPSLRGLLLRTALSAWLVAAWLLALPALLTFLTGLLSGLVAALALLIISSHLLFSISALARTLSLTFAFTFAATLARFRLLITLTLAALTSLSVFRTRFTARRLTGLTLLIARLPLIALATPLSSTWFLPVLLTSFLRSAGLSKFALELIGQSIQLGLGELELLRIVAQHTLRGAFHAAS
jgi:hypothetical protein